MSRVRKTIAWLCVGALSGAVGISLSGWRLPAAQADSTSGGGSAGAPVGAAVDASSPPPMQQPAGPGPGGRNHDDGSDGGAPGEGQGGPHRGRQGQWNEEALPRALQFLKTYSPNRYAAYNNLRPMLQRRVAQHLVRQFLALDELRYVDKDLYSMSLEEIRLEDDIFGIVTKFNQDHPSPTAADRQKLHDDLDGPVRRLVEQRIAERTKRIELLKDRLKSEQAQLDTEHQNLEQDVEDRIKQEITEMGRPMLGFGGMQGAHRGGPSSRQSEKNQPHSAPTTIPTTVPAAAAVMPANVTGQAAAPATQPAP